MKGFCIKNFISMGFHKYKVNAMGNTSLSLSVVSYQVIFNTSTLLLLYMYHMYTKCISMVIVTSWLEQYI